MKITIRRPQLPEEAKNLFSWALIGMWPLQRPCTAGHDPESKQGMPATVNPIALYSVDGTAGVP